MAGSTTAQRTLHLATKDSQADSSMTLEQIRDALCTPGRPLPFAEESFEQIDCGPRLLAALATRAQRAALLRACRRLLRFGGALSLAGQREEDLIAVRDAERAPGLARLVGLSALPADPTTLVREPPPAPPDALVSVLIPAYKAEYFEECLRSAMAQTWTHLEIILCDDSEGEQIEAIARRCAQADERIRYERNERTLGGRANHLRCYARARGTYIKWLDDDDTLAPECIERELRCLEAHPAVTLVSAHRQRIDRNGAPLDDDAHTLRAACEDTRFEGCWAIDRFLAAGVNFIGEPTCALFRKGDLDGTRPDVISFAGRSPICAGDMAMWLTLLSKGDLIYLSQSLSTRRIHASQGVMNPRNQERLQQALGAMDADARDLGLRIEPGGPCESPAPLGAVPWWPADLVELDRDARRHGAAGRWDQAHSTLTRALGERPNSARLALRRGEASLLAGKWVRASRELMEAIRSDPQCVRAYLAMASAMARLGQDEQARECLQMAAALGPVIVPGRGFEPPEPIGLWMGLEGHLHIAALLPGQTLSFELCAHPEIDYGAMPLEVRIHDGEQLLRHLVFEHPERCHGVTLSFPEPRSHIDLRLCSSGAYRPFPRGEHTDPRRLSVYLHNTHLRP